MFGCDGEIGFSGIAFHRSGRDGENPFCERLIGSICRDCLNHVIILGESHLRRILGRYFHYYHKYRTHLSLEKDAPEPRPIQEVSLEEVIEIPEVGGLHHHYERHAA
jgi:putative transposase